MHRTCKNTSVKPDRKWWMTGVRNNEEFLLRPCWKQLFHLTKSAVIQVAKTVQALKIIHLSRWFTHTLTQKLLHTNGFTHKDLDRYFCTQKFFTHRRFAHRPSHKWRFYCLCSRTEPQCNISHTRGKKDAFHTDVFTQTFFRRRFYTQTLSDTDGFTHIRFTYRSVYTNAFTHKHFHTYRHFYIVTFYTQTQAISSWFYARLRTVDSQPRTPGRTTFGSQISIHISHPKTGIKQIEI